VTFRSQLRWGLAQLAGSSQTSSSGSRARSQRAGRRAKSPGLDPGKSHLTFGTADRSARFAHRTSDEVPGNLPGVNIDQALARDGIDRWAEGKAFIAQTPRARRARSPARRKSASLPSSGESLRWSTAHSR
jgi:hypothetical protein